jgi:Uma2 family endonuclease
VSELPVHAFSTAARFNRRQFEQMIAAGVFEDDDHIELLHGQLVKKMSPRGIPHQAALRRLTALLQRLGSEAVEVVGQVPFAAADDGLPEPDLCVLQAGTSLDAYPSRALLIVEVADSSLLKDRNEKGPIYAAANVPEYWVVDVTRQVVEVYREPLGDHYGRSVTARPGDRIELLELPGRAVAVADVFPGP